MLENLSGCSGVIAGTELYTIDLLKKSGNREQRDEIVDFKY